MDEAAILQIFLTLFILWPEYCRQKQHQSNIKINTESNEESD
jgi:hypothetical protein